MGEKLLALLKGLVADPKVKAAAYALGGAVAAYLAMNFGLVG